MDTSQTVAAGQPHGPDDVTHLARAVRLAAENVRTGGGPFGAVIVTADGRVFDGVNRVTATHDPTAHAEVTAIRAACRELGTFELSGAVLYSSCEPCPMCLASALWARVARVYFAANRHDAAGAGFDDAAFYEYFERPEGERGMPAVQLGSEDAARLAPFEAWARNDSRVEY